MLIAEVKGEEPIIVPMALRILARGEDIYMVLRDGTNLPVFRGWVKNIVLMDTSADTVDKPYYAIMYSIMRDARPSRQHVESVDNLASFELTKQSGKGGPFDSPFWKLTGNWESLNAPT